MRKIFGQDIIVKMRAVFIILATLAIGYFFASKVIESTQNLKSSINVIPQEIKSEHFINSSPAHNQFLAGGPVNIVINFNKALKSQSTQVYLSDKILETKSSISDRTIRVNFDKNSAEEGLYKVKYDVCLKTDLCEGGQFVYHLDTHNITQFANYANKNLVEINLTDNPEVGNLLVNYQATIRWLNNTSGSIKIKSDPQTFNNYYPPLNSEEIKKGESFEHLFNDPGEYFWYLDNNPKVKGRILVQSGR